MRASSQGSESTYGTTSVDFKCRVHGFRGIMSRKVNVSELTDVDGSARVRAPYSAVDEALVRVREDSLPGGSNCIGDGISNRASCYESRCDIPGRNCT